MVEYSSRVIVRLIETAFVADLVDEMMDRKVSSEKFMRNL